MDTTGVDLFSSPLNRYVLEKFLVMLGDKYRTAKGVNDELTTVIQYPWLATDLQKLPGMIYADCSILYRRKKAPAQDDLGSFFCTSKNTLLGPDGCANYKSFATSAPRFNNFAVTDAGIYISDAWTSTGVFALPGVPFKAKRVDVRNDIKLYVVLWYQRDGTTKSFDAGGDGYTQYTRPQYPRSPYILLTNNTEITITSPHGGPIYFGLVSNGVARTSSAPLKVIFSDVAKHPTILDVGNSSQLAAFPQIIKNNVIPILDIKAPGMELHMRSDFFLASLTNVDYLQNYSGPSGVETLLYDLRFNFLESQMTLAGFKAPGKQLVESLPTAVQTACTAMKWNCTDDSVHIFQGIQHANYDDRAQCGSSCSGNPFDMDWNILPMGWGEGHELGHNMQMSLLQISYLPDGKSKETWSNYVSRAAENSNNIFPYHKRWKFFRKYKAVSGVIPSGSSWNGHVVGFSYMQSTYAQTNTSVSGTMRTVVYDEKCVIQSNCALGTTPPYAVHSALYENSAYAANNDARMSFYLQLKFIMTGKSVAGDAVTLSNGFYIFTLLYQAARTFNYNAKSDAAWRKNRGVLGFDLFNRTCGTADPCRTTYGTNDVRSMPGITSSSSRSPTSLATTGALISISTGCSSPLWRSSKSWRTLLVGVRTRALFPPITTASTTILRPILSASQCRSWRLTARRLGPSPPGRRLDACRSRDQRAIPSLVSFWHQGNSYSMLPRILVFYTYIQRLCFIDLIYIHILLHIYLHDVSPYLLIATPRRQVLLVDAHAGLHLCDTSLFSTTHGFIESIYAECYCMYIGYDGRPVCFRPSFCVLLFLLPAREYFHI